MLAMPAASAGVLDEFAEKNFPTIVALQDEYKNKSTVLEGMEYFERWREYVDQGVAKLQEWGDKLKEKGMTLALDHFSEKIDDYVNENAPLKIESGSADQRAQRTGRQVQGGAVGGRADGFRRGTDSVFGAHRHQQTHQPGQCAPGAGRRRQRTAGPGLSWIRNDTFSQDKSFGFLVKNRGTG